MCKIEIETEAHILFDCKSYKDLRKAVKVLANVNDTLSSDILAKVMMADNEETVIQLSRFLYFVFQLRATAIQHLDAAR